MTGAPDRRDPLRLPPHAAANGFVKSISFGGIPLDPERDRAVADLAAVRELSGKQKAISSTCALDGKGSGGSKKRPIRQYTASGTATCECAWRAPSSAHCGGTSKAVLSVTHHAAAGHSAQGHGPNKCDRHRPCSLSPHQAAFP